MMQAQGSRSGQSGLDESVHSIKMVPIQDLPPEYLQIVNSFCLDVSANWEKNEEDERIRLMGVRDLECFLRVSFPNISLQLFGSSCNGFGLKTSDLDIGLIPCPTYVPPPSVNQIGKMLRKCRWITKVFTISQAKVPIVKFTHKDLKLDGDISILEDGALMNTRLLKAYSMIDPRVKEFDMVKDVISVRRAGQMTKVEKGWSEFFFLCIEDPITPDVNIAKNMSHEKHFNRFKDILSKALAHFTSPVNKIPVMYSSF
ncbi:unnamed protein product, partial [Darwinula stevensoni]